MIYDHGTWTNHFNPHPNLLFGPPSCVSRTFCVDNSGSGGGGFEIFDGSAFSPIVPADGGSGNPISCTATTFCATVGDTRASIFDGRTVTETQAGVGGVHDGQATSLSCTSASFCELVDNFAAASYDGTQWGGATTLLDTNDFIVQQPARFTGGPIGCASPAFCNAEFDANSTNEECISCSDQIGLQLKDGVWGSIPPGHRELGRSSCVPDANWCMAPDTGYSDPTGFWIISDTTSTFVPTPEHAGSVSCTSTSFCVGIVGGRPAIYDGSSFGAPATVDPGHDLGPVSCVGHRCVVADDAGRVLTFDGTSWSAPLRVENQELANISCGSASLCVAIDLYGRATHFDGTSWSAPVYVDGAKLVDVSCPNGHFCLALDASGMAYTGH